MAELNIFLGTCFPRGSCSNLMTFKESLKETIPCHSRICAQAWNADNDSFCPWQEQSIPRTELPHSRASQRQGNQGWSPPHHLPGSGSSWPPLPQQMPGPVCPHAAPDATGWHFLSKNVPGTMGDGLCPSPKASELQIGSSACGSPLQRVNSWDLWEISGFEEMSGFHLAFGRGCEFFPSCKSLLCTVLAERLGKGVKSIFFLGMGTFLILGSAQGLAGWGHEQFGIAGGTSWIWGYNSGILWRNNLNYL